jgi:hypothetical protein
MKNKIDGKDILSLDGAFKKLIKDKKTKQKSNRFTYSDDTGLRVLSEKDIVESLSKEDKEEEKEIKKSYEQWL